MGWPGCRGTPSCRPPWSPSVTSFYSEALSIISVKSHYCNCKDSQDIKIWEGYVFGRQSTLNYNCHSPKKEQENPNKNDEWQHPALRAKKDKIRDNSQEKVLTMSQYTMSVVIRLSTNNSSLFSNKLTTFKTLVLFGKQHKCIPKGTLKSACEIFLWSFLQDFCNIPQEGFPRKRLLHLLASVSAFLRQFCPVLTLKRVFWVRREVSTGNCGFYRVHYSISCRSALRPRLHLYYWSTCTLQFSGLFTA